MARRKNGRKNWKSFLLPKPNRKKEREEKRLATRLRRRSFSEAVRERDGERCQNPRCPNKGKLVAVSPHHIMGKRASIPELDDPENGICLCELNCHPKAQGDTNFMIAILESKEHDPGFCHADALEYLRARRDRRDLSSL